MRRRLKLLLLSAAIRSGVSKLVLGSSWRQRRLLILCYHGTSLDDEHDWEPRLYIPPAVLRQRFEYLRQQRCAVLPLNEAVERLYAGTLPAKSVALTFDDGTYDFCRQVAPMLLEFGFPATVYLTTYYCEFNRPVFDTMCDYLLWKGHGQHLQLPELGGNPILVDERGRVTAREAIKQYARQRRLSGKDKDALLARMASLLHTDYEDLCRRRILHLMTREEVRTMERAGIDVQLHTHRHRVSRQRDLFIKELEDNRKCLAGITDGQRRHFCYPSGVYLPEFVPWLSEYGIKSATTCKPGIATSRTSPWLLPRLVDWTSLTMTEFAGWVSGIASLLPQRTHVVPDDQFLEESPPEC